MIFNTTYKITVNTFFFYSDFHLMYVLSSKFTLYIFLNNSQKLEIPQKFLENTYLRYIIIFFN